MNNHKINQWIPIHNVITPGGDPYYECPYCKYGHLYDVENINNYHNKCPSCRSILKYPFESEGKM